MADLRSEGDVLLDGQFGTIEHHGCETAVDALATFIGGARMIDMGHDGHGCLFRQLAEHGTQHRNRSVFAAARTGLQDDRPAGFLSGLGKGEGVFPSQNHETGDRVFSGSRRLQGRRAVSQVSFELRDHVFDAGDRFDLPGMVRLEILHQ